MERGVQIQNLILSRYERPLSKPVPILDRWWKDIFHEAKDAAISIDRV